MDQKEMHKLIDINETSNTMTVKFLLNTVNSFANEDEPWQTIADKFSDSEMQNLRLDFSQVRFLSSVTLGKILHMNRKFKDHVELTNINSRIMEVFKVSGLDRVVSIVEVSQQESVTLGVVG